MERIRLEFDANAIEKQIALTLQEMGKIHDASAADSLKCVDLPGFADSLSDQGLIITAEALECFFIPYFGVRGIREKFWKEELINIKNITAALQYLVNDYKEDLRNDGTYGLSGTPYVNFKVKQDTNQNSEIKRNLDFMDTACFMLTALLDAKAIQHERQALIDKKELPPTAPSLIPEEMMGKVNQRIYDCALLIKEADLGDGRGWAYTNDKLEEDRQDQLYFTWNALEALDTLLFYAKKAPFLIPEKINALWGVKGLILEIENKYLEKRSYLSAKFMSPDNKDLYICNNVAAFGAEDSTLYYNLFAFISLLITGYEDSGKVADAMKFLIIRLKDPATVKRVGSKDYGKFFIEGSLQNLHETQWAERAFMALLVKALSTFKERHPQACNTMLEDVKTELGDDPRFKSIESLISYYVDVIDQQKYVSPDNSYANIWDKTYSIYYTQRVLESLNKIYITSFKQLVPADLLSEVKEKKASSSTQSGIQIAPVVKIEITGDLIKNEIILAAKEAAQKELMELLKSEKLRPYIEKELSSISDFRIEDNIKRFFDYVLTNLHDENPEQRYINFATSMQEIVGVCIGEVIYAALKAIDADKISAIDKTDFVGRFKKGMEYLLKMETERGEEAIDFVKTFQVLEEKGLLQLTKKATTLKKKR